MEKMRVLITVKTYPQPSAKYEETVCTAGIREQGGFVRLHPVRFRRLPYGAQYRKYQWIEVEAERHPGDSRPETYRPNIESVKVLGEPMGTDGAWATRKRWVLPHLSSSLEALRGQQRVDETSLGLIRPRQVPDLQVSPATDDTPRSRRQLMEHPNLLDDNLTPLEPLPFTFRYRFRCEGPACKGHRMSVIDWELGQLWRRARRRARDDAEAIEKVRAKFLGEICARDRDVYFFVGNQFQPHLRSAWLVLGVFWPPKQPQLALPLDGSGPSQIAS